MPKAPKNVLRAHAVAHLGHADESHAKVGAPAGRHSNPLPSGRVRDEVGPTSMPSGGFSACGADGCRVVSVEDDHTVFSRRRANPLLTGFAVEQEDDLDGDQEDDEEFDGIVDDDDEDDDEESESYDDSVIYQQPSAQEVSEMEASGIDAYKQAVMEHAAFLIERGRATEQIFNVLTDIRIRSAYVRNVEVDDLVEEAARGR